MMNSLTRMASLSRLKLAKKAPQILFGAGIVGSVATVVLASLAAIKAQDIMHEQEDHRAQLEEYWREKRIAETEYQSTVVDQYRHTGFALTKAYAPTVVVGVVSVVCLTRSHQILTNRNTALTVAYTGLHKAMSDYRARVVAEQGEQKDQEYLHGTVLKEIEVEGKNGKISTKEVVMLDPDGRTPYSYLFDETNRCWEKDPGYNATFLENQQRWANIELQARGYLFLSEVYKMIGVEPTKTSQIVGWVRDANTDQGDGYIDFGFSKHGEFMAGYERSVWLDFNVDGDILDLI